MLSEEEFRERLRVNIADRPHVSSCYGISCVSCPVRPPSPRVCQLADEVAKAFVDGRVVIQDGCFCLVVEDV